MNNREVMIPVQRFGWSDKNVPQVRTEMQAAFAEDGYLICDGFATAQECSEMILQADKLIAAFNETEDQVVFSASGQSHAASDYFMESASQISCFLEAGLLIKLGALSNQRRKLSTKLVMLYMILILFFRAFHARTNAQIWCVSWA